MSRHPHPSIDPRDPLVFDTRDLGRRPGSLRELRRTVPAPAGLGVELVGVPLASPLSLDVRLESVVEGVLATIEVSGELTGECARCLDAFVEPLGVRVQELYRYAEATDRHAGPAAPDDDEDDTPALVGDYFDVTPALRDAVVLALPLAPLCRPDCPGLCAQCGVHLAAAGPHHTHDGPDPRWAGLRTLMEE